MKQRTLILGAILTVAGFWAGDKISYQVRADIAAGEKPTDVAQQFWFDLRNPLHLSFDGFDLLIGVAVAFILLLTLAYQTTKTRSTRAGVEHGSSRWGDERDIKPFIDSDYRQNLLFSRTERLSLDSRKTQRNQHVMVIGSSGSGKTRYYVQPNIAQLNQSYVVTDPNGEIMQATGAKLEAAGYKVRSLNLVDWSKTETFNPLAYFSAEQAEVDCMILVQNIISNTTGKAADNTGGFWEKAERALLTALVAYVYGRKGAEGTLNDVIELLAKMQTSEAQEGFISEGDKVFLGMKKVLDKHDPNNPKNANREYDDSARTTLRMWQFSWSQYNIYTQGAGETRKSVLISLGVRLGPLHMPALSRMLSGNSIEAAKIGEERTAVFLIIPDSHETFSFLVSVFYDMFFQKNIALADALPEKRLPVPIHCYMDEFANIGKLPSFHTKIAVMRKRGIAVSVIMQNYAQGKSIYGDDWETIVGNCDSKLFLGGDEESTTKWIANRLGKETINQRDDTSQRGGQGFGTASQMFRKIGRELLTPDEIARLDGGECLYMLRGVPPFRSKKLKPVPSGSYEYVPISERSTDSEPSEPPSDSDTAADSGEPPALPAPPPAAASAPTQVTTNYVQPQSVRSAPVTPTDRARFAAAGKRLKAATTQPLPPVVKSAPSAANDTAAAAPQG
ncbi:VirD4-like conjugal transfer protein, CD1115 family [uncultured Gulosibacter sp.]|uniref:VirD4-like conjugal transfer protein, CD1115 family n=1 Tax=uncultured Gulosibacter sp. TaxID=1339167 RepID=UPI0028893CB6|nr:type IV secretory system conjugative DNA transfer family protein [uncultured Gulosibacter sp.]